jgi:hypothetical protein
LLSRIHPRKGLFLRRWGPHVARQIDLLVTLKLVDWEIDSEEARGLMHLTLTNRGRRIAKRD